MGVAVWPMVELEADDALAAAARIADEDDEVEQVLIWTPDKDLAQCVRGDRVVQVDRRAQAVRNAAGVREKFGVDPVLIPDFLALVGDSADGYPGIPGIGRVSAARILNEHGPIEECRRRCSAREARAGAPLQGPGDAAQRHRPLRRRRRPALAGADRRPRRLGRRGWRRPPGRPRARRRRVTTPQRFARVKSGGLAPNFHPGRRRPGRAPRNHAMAGQECATNLPHGTRGLGPFVPRRGLCEHMFVSDRGDDPARRPRRVLRVGRAARRPAAARPAGDRRRRGRAGRQLRGQGLRRAHRDGRPAGAGSCARRRSSCRRGCRAYSEASKAVFAVFDDTTPLVEGLSIDEAFLDVARAGADRRHAGRDRRAAAPARCASEVGLPITVGVARTKFLAKVASGVAKPDGLLVVPPERRARVPAPAAGRAAVGRRAGHRAQAARARASPPSARSPRLDEDALVAMLGRGVRAAPARAGPQPRPAAGAGAAAGGARSGRSARSAAGRGRRRPRRRRWSALVDRVTRRMRGGRPASAAPSCCGCASTTSPAPPARTRCPGRPPRRPRSWPPPASCWPRRCR